MTLSPRETALAVLLCMTGCPPVAHVSQLVVYAPPPPPRPLGPPAPLRVIHASPDPTVAHVVLTVDGRIAAQDIPFGGAAGYGEVPAGHHTIQLHPRQLPPTTPPPLSEELQLMGPHASTLIVHGLLVGTPNIAFVQADDTTSTPAAGHGRLRFFHAAVGLGVVEICIATRGAHRPGFPLFAGGDEGAFLVAETALVDASPQWADVEVAEAVTLQLREQNVDDPCHGTELGTATIVVPDQARVTLVAIGRLDGDPAVAPAILVCPDGPLPDARCDSVPIGTGR